MATACLQADPVQGLLGLVVRAGLEEHARVLEPDRGGSLFQLAEELAGDPAAPAAEVENLALMARMFDFDGLRALAGRLQQTCSGAD